MLRSTRLAIFLGLLVGFAVPAVTSADVWSIKSDCEEGDWSVTVTLDGLGAVDVSCLDGAKTERTFDTGALVVTDAHIEATSALGTYCQLPSGGDSKVVLECSSRSENSAGLEAEDELEVEIEREEAELEDEEEAEEEEEESDED
jgi:hypothetical protein